MGDMGRDVPSGSRTVPKEELKISPSEQSLYRKSIHSHPYQQPRGYLTTKPGQVQMKTGSSSFLESASGRPQTHPESRKESEKAGADTSGEPPPLPLLLYLCPGLQHGSRGLWLPWVYLYMWPTDGGRAS